MSLVEVKEIDKIHLKQSKAGLLAGLFLIGVAVVLSICLICIDGGPPMVVILIGMVFIWGYFGLLGGHMLYSYYKLGQGLRASLNCYGESYLLEHIKSSAVKQYRNFLPSSTVYFTDRFVIVPGCAVFEYSSIVQMYKERDRSGKVVVSCIVFELADGSKPVLFQGVMDEEVVEIIDLCQGYNPQIRIK